MPVCQHCGVGLQGLPQAADPACPGLGRAPQPPHSLRPLFPTPGCRAGRCATWTGDAAGTGRHWAALGGTGPRCRLGGWLCACACALWTGLNGNCTGAGAGLAGLDWTGARGVVARVGAYGACCGWADAAEVRNDLRNAVTRSRSHHHRRCRGKICSVGDCCALHRPVPVSL